MRIAQFVRLGAAKLSETTKALVVQAFHQLSEDDPNDVESFGEVDFWAALGLTAMPYPSDQNGYAEGVMLRTASGHLVCVGGSDTRTASIVGNLKPGDTVLHSTGPSQAAQVQLKEEKRQALLVTKDVDGQTLVSGLDGKKKQWSTLVDGHYLEASADHGICLIDKTGKAGIQIKDGVVSIFGAVVLGGRTPVAPILGGSPGTPTPIPGVFYGS